MSGVYQIPSSRDLPSGRLSQRREHLLAEIARDRESDRAPAPMRLPWFHRPKFVALVAVTFLLVATATAFGVRALILDEGFVGVPPDGATPSTPERGELVLSYFGDPAATEHRLRAWVYADGRLIWEQQGPLEDDKCRTCYLEQRLTPEGVELLLSEFISTGLFDRDVVLVPRSRDPQGGWAVIEVRNGNRWVTVDFGGGTGPRGHWPTLEPTPEQEDAIDRLGALLADPGSWLPASAWENREVRAYVASRYEVCLGNSPLDRNAQPLELSEILTVIPAAAADLLREAELTVDERTLADGRSRYCSDIRTEKAQALAKALDAAGLPRAFSLPLTHWYLIPPSLDGRPVVIDLRAHLPHGPICEDCG